ncbi:cytochrome P450 [Xanthomonas campestris pv. parthenii]|nr:cytochrome P450 [Xanthomonas campestris pv. parthenii]
MLALHSQPAKRATRFAPKMQNLLDEHVGDDLFRLDKTTVGISGAALIEKVLGARPALESERPTFKPLRGRSIPKAHTSKVMQALGRDVRHALAKPWPSGKDLTGSWPHVGHQYLCEWVFGDDPLQMRMVVDRLLVLAPPLTWAAISASALFPFRLGPHASELATLTAAASTYEQRRFALGLYRRAAGPICIAISTLVTNAIWLASPFDPELSNRSILYETMRLLPPSWSIRRSASPEYCAIDPRIGLHDDVLVFPFLSHRHPGIWEEPDSFCAARWDRLDPDSHPGYFPFGGSSERCWGMHLVMPLAERLLDLLRQQGLGVSSRQLHADVPQHGLLGILHVDVVRR